MINNLRNTPRKFDCGDKNHTEILDYGEIHLGDSELISFVMETGQRFDVVRKSWGFHATPSINQRLKKEGFKTALVKNNLGRHFIMLVAIQRLEEFQNFCKQQETEVMTWLDELDVMDSVI